MLVPSHLGILWHHHLEAWTHKLQPPCRRELRLPVPYSSKMLCVSMGCLCPRAS